MTSEPLKKLDILPLDYIRYVMDQMGFSQRDLVRAGCGRPSHVSEILSRKRKINLRFIRAFLKASHREEFAYVLIRDYKLKK